MAIPGKYCEPLKSGGELIVTPQGWHIKYYFFGPDFRYNGEHITIPGKDVGKYIQAYKDNFSKYLSLKETIPSDGSFNMVGKCNMNIGVGIYNNGVTISQWFNSLPSGNFPIKTEKDLNIVVSDYLYCQERAEEIFNILFAK